MAQEEWDREIIPNSQEDPSTVIMDKVKEEDLTEVEEMTGEHIREFVETIIKRMQIERKMLIP